MCLGVPMRVVESDGYVAVVERRAERRRVSLLLVGDVAVGTPLLVLSGNAVRVLDEAEVPLIDDALDALEKALSGQPLTGHFADLEAREPELPLHLQKREAS